MRPQRTVTWLTPNDGADWFPPIEQALDEPDGLLAAGGDLSTQRILAGYRRGIFPWYSPGQPILWWSPDPREVLWPQEFKLHRSLAKTIRNRGFTTTFDQAFKDVVAACAAPRERHTGTWITDEMRSAYGQLHRVGAAHSVEVWEANRLVGGLYGVLLGRVFFGESMFSRERDASKTALAALVARGLTTGLELIDCQMATPHLRTLGSRPLARAQFVATLAKLTAAAPATTFATSNPVPS
jgi:leucyl/phenylalanyl-tRNA---protein transferase